MTAPEIEAVLLSMQVAGWAVVCSLPVGIATAWLLARCQFPGKLVVDGFVHLPLVLPPVSVGYLLLVLLGRNGILGAWFDTVFGVTFVFSWRGAAVAAAVMAFPLMVRAIRLSFEAVDPGLETAARTLGARPWRVFFIITLPLAAPGVISGAVLAFARCLGEFGATIAFAANIPGETRTIPLAIFTELQTPDGAAAATRLTLVSIALAFAALLLSELLARRLGHRKALR